MDEASSESLTIELKDIKERLKRIETSMVTKEDIDALMETVEVLSINPRILKEIDDALEEYRKGEYHTYEEVFGEK
jgi:5-bromo-4-chloroindolyl phosphate hydrolysis protein